MYFLDVFILGILDGINLAHIHLLVNHFPIIGFMVGLGLLIGAVVTKNKDLTRYSYVVLFLMAVMAIPAYMSGNAAEETICPPPNYHCLPGVSSTAIRQHEDAALIAFSLIEITGFLAWLGLWQSRLKSGMSAWNLPVVFVLSIVTFAAMARTGYIGGDIRHMEIQSTHDQGVLVMDSFRLFTALRDHGFNPGTANIDSPEMAAALSKFQDEAKLPITGKLDEATLHVLQEPYPSEETAREGLARRLGSFVVGKTYVWPSCETLHFVGLSLLFTVVFLVDLRMLGMGKSLSFSSLYQLLPFGMVGFGLNLVTGMFFFIGAAQQYTKNPIFYWKIIFVVLCGLNVLYFMLLDEPWKVKSGDDAPMTAKLVAASAIFLWVGVLFFGHMLPFLGNAF
jgi:uncharacterized membrane protein